MKDIRLTHWGRVTHICVAYLTIIASDNGLSPSRCKAIVWTNARILLIRPLGTNFSEILIEIHIYSFKKMYLKMSPAKRRPFCLGLNVLNQRKHRFFYHQPNYYYVQNSVIITSPRASIWVAGTISVAAQYERAMHKRLWYAYTQ